MNERPARWRDLLVILLLLCLPAALLGECLFGGRKYLPYDLAEFPPLSTTLTAEQVTQLREGSNYDATEAPVWFMPELALARRSLADGKYPHWNPYARSGLPLTAHGHLGLLDPLHWPALLLRDPADSLLCLTYEMFALAGVLMYALLRALRLQRLSALFGAVAFAWSGTMTANGHWYQRMEPLALLPGLLWLQLLLVRARGWARLWPALGLAVMVLLCWTAGFPPFCIPVMLLAGGFGVLLVLRTARQQGGRQGLAVCGWLALGLVLGLLLAAPQLLQQLQYFRVAHRNPDPSLMEASKDAFAPCGLLGYLFPELFSHPSDRSLPAAHSALPFLWSNLREWGTGRALWPSYNFTEYALFPGTLTLLLAFVGLLGRGPRWRWLAVAGLLLLFLLAIGAGPAKYAFLLPGIGAVQPYRYVGPACALVALLAALGCERLLQAPALWLLRSLAGGALAVGITCLILSATAIPEHTTVDDPWLVEIAERYREPAATHFGVPADAVTPANVLRLYFTGADQADLIRRARERLHWDLRRTGAVLLLAAALALLTSLRRDRPLAGWLGPAWLLLAGAELGSYGLALNHGKLLPVPWTSAVHDFLRAQRAQHASDGGIMIARAGPQIGDPWFLPPGPLALDGIRDLQFYTFVDGRSGRPLRQLYGDSFPASHDMARLLPDDERLQLPWWDLLGIRYLVAAEPLQHAGARVGPELKGPGGEFFVYERPNVLPRAWVVPAVRSVADDQAAVLALIAPELAPRDYVLMTPGELQRLGTPPAAEPSADQRPVAFTFESPSRLRLQVGAGAPGYLVVADTCLPGWTATVNGRPVEIACGNLFQRVLSLPAESCEVVFRYFTPGLLPGLALAALAVIAGVVLVLRALLRPADPPPAADRLRA